MEIAGKACLVTGGTSGIGEKTALAFASKGALVAVAGRSIRREALKRIEDTCTQHGGRTVFIQGDVGVREDCVRMVAETEAAFGHVDVLVHAAGGSASGGIFDITDDRWRNAFDVHVHAILVLARAALPQMIKQKEGAIILIGSAAGHRGCLGAIAYGVVKGALPQFARSLARELGDYNIRVNCVSPGIIRTPFQDSLTAAQVEHNLKNRIPLRREGNPKDVARAILELTENDFITGQDLVVDGGMTMRIV